MRSIVVDVDVVERPRATTPKPPLPPPTVVAVVVAGRDGPGMEGDCADAASVTKIPLNFHSSHPILHLI